jgi:hypothetical protein
MGYHRPDPRLVRGLAWGAIFVVAVMAGCNFQFGVGPTVQGSGVKKTEKRAVGPFTAIEISGAVQLEFVVGKEASVEITTDDNLLPLVVTEVEGGTLKIQPTGSTSTQIGVVARVTAPQLTALKASGATGSTVTGLKEKAFHLAISGASRTTLSGSAERLDITCAGASHVDGTNLESPSVHLDVSGASTVDLGTSRSLSGSVSGASTVHYQGSPENKLSVSGASSAKPK